MKNKNALEFGNSNAIMNSNKISSFKSKTFLVFLKTNQAFLQEIHNQSTAYPLGLKPAMCCPTMAFDREL